MRTLLGLAALLLATTAHAGEVIVDFLDVGQGDGILVRGGGKTVLIDAGTRKAKVAEQLAALDVTSIDLAITSHPHADHMGGMEDVVRTLPVGLYIDNGMTHTTQTYQRLMLAIEELGIPYRTGRTGLNINMGDEASLRILLPGDTLLRDTRSDLNSNSVVVVLTHGDMDFLFTGDAEMPTEGLITRQDLPSIDVLKVAHHGSEHSSSTSFLRTVRPPIAVISAGEGNRYGHPDPEALERLHSAGALVYRTDQSGHIRAISNGETVEVLEMGNLTGLTADPPAMTAAVERAGSTTVRTGPSQPAATQPAPLTPAVAPATTLNLSGVRQTEPEPELTPRQRRKLEKQRHRDARRAR